MSYNKGNSSKNVTGASVVDGTLENADFADNGLSGDKIDGGTISNFTSTGIDDNATSTAITIDASEKVGIGTISPTGRLNIAPIGNIGGSGGTMSNAGLRIGTTTASSMYLDTNEVHGSETLNFFSNGTDNSVADYIRFSTGGSAGAERMRVTDNGLTFNGDTVAANALDDYEEGTWTPSVGGTATYTTQTGFYTKIGQMVTLQFEITINAIGTGDTVNISGVPFSGGSNLDSGCNIYYFSGLASNVVFVGSYLNSSVIALRSTAAAASSVNAASILGNGSRIGGTLTYKVI